MKKEIRLSGSGGQGLILAGVILAESAILSDLNAVQSQSYGPEARGGASKAEVIISDKEINFPKVIESDILISLTQKSFEEYVKNIKNNSVVIVDSAIDIGHLTSANIYKVPIIKTANEVIQKPMTANIVTLGVLGSLMNNIIDKECLKRAIIQRVPKGSEEVNSKAFEIGYSLIGC